MTKPTNTPDKEKIALATRALLEAMGEDPLRPGLLDTPDRVARSWTELLSGNAMNPEAILAREFPSERYDEMVTLRGVPFYSICEHHLLPFFGTATIAYIPNEDSVVGLSKLARLLECFAKRLQIQERITVQIGHALQEHLSPRGYGVSLRAVHLCMCARGVSKQGTEMVTTSVGGLIKDDSKARSEFLRLAGL